MSEKLVSLFDACGLGMYMYKHIQLVNISTYMYIFVLRRLTSFDVVNEMYQTVEFFLI